MNACVLLRSESIVATPDPLSSLTLLRDWQRVSLGDLVDGSYIKNKPSTLPARILKIDHHHRFRSFKLTNSTSLGEYLDAG